MGGFDYKEWYEENKKAVAARRRERYREDPEYRKKCAEWGREARKKSAEARRSAVGLRSHGTREPEEVEWGGRKVLAYGTDVLSRYIKRAKATIYAWEQKGWLPTTPLLSRRGEKLYTPGMMKHLKDVVKRWEPKGLSHGRAKVDGDALRTEIWDGWMRLKEEGEPNVRITAAMLMRLPKIEVRDVEVEGKVHEAFTLEMLARAVGKSKYQLPNWEKQGFMPETPFRSTRRWRLYTREMIEAVKQAYEQRGLTEEMARQIEAEWRKLGVEPRK